MPKIIEIGYIADKRSISFKLDEQTILKPVTSIKEIHAVLDSIHDYDEHLEDLYIGEELKLFLNRVNRCDITSMTQTKDILSVYVTNLDVMKNYIEDHHKEFIATVGLKGTFNEEKDSLYNYLLQLYNGKATYIYKLLIVQSRKPKHILTK